MAHLVGHVRRRIRRVAAARWAGGGEAVRRALRGGAIQPKLKVGPPDDAYEREADAVAARVMAGQAGPTPSSAAATPGQVQRVCAACEEEALMSPSDQIRRQPVEEEEEEAQAKALPEAVQRQPMEEEEEEEPVQAKPVKSAPVEAGATASGVPAPTAPRSRFQVGSADSSSGGLARISPTFVSTPARMRRRRHGR